MDWIQSLIESGEGEISRRGSCVRSIRM